MSGRLIVFEGPDGAGKTSLAEKFAAVLRESGEPTTVLAFPGNEVGTLGNLVYHIHHATDKLGLVGVSPTSLQALHVAAHLDAIDRVIRPLIDRNHTVVLDRYWWSTWVYGMDGGANPETLEHAIAAERAHWGTLIPDCVVLLNRQDSLRSNEAGDTWSRRSALYAGLGRREAGIHPVHLISNDLSQDQTLQAIVSVVGARPQSEGR